jgi:hypothetical protein
VTKRDWHRRAFERRDGLAQDVLTLLLLGIAALASAETWARAISASTPAERSASPATDADREERWR